MCIRDRVIRVRNDIRNAEVQLNRYLGFSPDEAVQYVGRLEDFHGGREPSEEKAIESAVLHRPDLIVARKSVEVAYKDMHVAMGRFLPQVDITYDNMHSSRNYDSRRYKDYDRDYWSLGLNFSWELFSGGGTSLASMPERKRAQALQKEYEQAMSCH